MPREEAHNNDIHLKVRKIFIGGIRHRTDEDTLKNYFEKYGNINGCLLLQNKDGKSRGFAFIEFDGKENLSILTKNSFVHVTIVNLDQDHFVLIFTILVNKKKAFPMISLYLFIVSSRNFLIFSYKIST